VNKIEAAEFLTLSAAFTGREPSVEQAGMWSLVLDDIPLDEALQALRAHYRSSRFPVMPADIVERGAEIRASRTAQERREVISRSRRAQNADHRRELLGQCGRLRDVDLLWASDGWDGDDQQDDPLATNVAQPESIA
jgi:hypothetical protein